MSSAAPTYDLGKLHGGLRLPAEKAESTAQQIQRMPVPKQIVLPIAQHVGEPAHPIVGIGENVRRGQLVAENWGSLSAPVHASTSGKVVAIEPWPVSRRFGNNAPCIVIDCDGEDLALESPDKGAPYKTYEPTELLERILQGGIVGLGGAVFPTGQKLMQARSMPLEFLILSGVECEPNISCDDRLIRDQSAEALGGAQILMHALNLPSCYVVIESDKPEAINAVGEAMAELDDKRIVLKQVPTIYPSGGEDQLVQLVTNREVPSGGLPTDVGCVVQNVGTAAAIYRWICEDEPLISRITTVTGPGVREPMNVLARVGTTVADVIDFAGGYNEGVDQLVIGGPMCGKSVSTDRVPLVKATNCILALTNTVIHDEPLPCIRCGECASVCPIQLLPQQLYWHTCADDEAKLRTYGLTDCIECGCCDLVCPSHIPLTAEFRNAKARMQELADEKARAERARRRFESRNERREQEKLDRDEELRRQKDNARKAGPEAIEEIVRRQRKKHDQQEDGEE